MSSIRRQDATAGAKPVDVGDGRLVASFAASRPALLSLTCYQPEHGVAELSAATEFDEPLRGDPGAVRRYRALLASDDFPCLWLQGEREGGPADTTDAERTRWNGAAAWAEHGAIVLSWSNIGEGPPARVLRFRGRLDRPALAEITELDPQRPTGAATSIQAEGSRLVIRSTLPAAIAIDADTGMWTVDGAEATLDPGFGQTLIVRITSLDDLPPARPTVRAPHRSPIVARALAYTRGCAALATAPDEVAILADHRLLPLSWTRDAYYQALMLLATTEPLDAELVADHLRWLWRRCERPEGRWVRSHHANGRPKDLAFQADQQLYPIVELADYWRAQGRLPAGVDWNAEVSTAWEAVAAEIDPRTGLISTAENAADDQVLAPFVGSSQILLWYTTLRLAELAEADVLSLHAADMRALAERTRRAFDTQLLFRGRWLYATDTRDRHLEYHDANDLPVALAPLLGFCSPDDQAWRATMEFAFSPGNPGYFEGERGGLGSAHTPAPWTLGDVQAWIVARAMNDAPGMAAATARLGEVAFHDGMLPEAYSATREPDVRIRHWFAWPGAAFGALTLLDGRGELDRLRAR